MRAAVGKKRAWLLYSCESLLVHRVEAGVQQRWTQSRQGRLANKGVFAMRRYLTYLVAFAAFGMFSSPNAEIINLTANLTPFGENPTAPLFGAGATSIGPPPGQLKLFTQGPTSGIVPDLTGGSRLLSTGFAQFTLDTALPVLTMTVTVSNIDFTGSQTPGINDNLTAAHIHAGVNAIPGVSAAPVVWGFFGLPFNDTINGPPSAIPGDCVPFSTGVGGTCTGTWDATEGNMTMLSAQLTNIINGLSYINFHTLQFPAGEIRGQLLAQVPEPSTLGLFGAALIGFMGLGWLRRRRRF
jgi:hypothetical protein